MEDKILAALLDLRLAIGELQAAMTNVEKAARKLTAVQLDALAAKNTPCPLSIPQDNEEGSH
jgi:tRNA U34 5-methylaminomethyl-2-thiouridine-forming methyltransferase MnmC